MENESNDDEMEKFEMEIEEEKPVSKKKKHKKKKFMLFFFLIVLSLIWVIIIYYIVNIIKNITFIHDKKIEIEILKSDINIKNKIKKNLEEKKNNLTLDIDDVRRELLSTEFSIKLKEDSINKLDEQIKEIQKKISSF